MEVLKIIPIFAATFNNTSVMKKIWFDADYIYAETSEGQVLKQSLLWYPALRGASADERARYTMGLDGIHWRELDTDISFESFRYEDAEPTDLQRFFLTHRELNVSEFAKRMGMNATLLRNYINGFKKPSAQREAAILSAIASLGREYVQAGMGRGVVADDTPVEYG